MTNAGLRAAAEEQGQDKRIITVASYRHKALTVSKFNQAKGFKFIVH